MNVLFRNSAKVKLSPTLEFIRLYSQKVDWQVVKPFVRKWQWYWWIILSMGIFVIIFEIIEHLITNRPHIFFIVSEIILFTLYLLATGFLIKIFLVNLQEKNLVIDILHQKNTLNAQLALVHDIDELAELIIQYVMTTTHAVCVRLYVYNRFRNQLYLAAQGGIGRQTSTNGRVDFQVESCKTCIARRGDSSQLTLQSKLENCLHPLHDREGYCLPLSHGRMPVGMLHLYFASEINHTEHRIRQIENVIEEITSATGIAVEKKAREEYARIQMINTFQLDIARDLHDTIVQNIGYLRMKLDYLSENSSETSPEIGGELKHMLSVANESYDLIRGTLTVLQSNGSASLFDLLGGHARFIADRSKIKIDFVNQGEPEPLSPAVMRQLYYIFREALSNVEKHAKANHVRVEIVWDLRSLTLVLTDNGTGFDTDIVQGNYHYGLRFMHERAERINGKLDVRSSPGSGTSIKLTLPYE